MGNKHPHQQVKETLDQSRQDQSPKTFESNKKDFEKPRDLNETARTNDDQKSSGDLEKSPINPELGPKNAERMGKLLIFLIIITCLVSGKYLKFSSEIPCVDDKVLDLLKFANDFLNTPGKEAYRNFFQGVCSFTVDLTFLATFGYWAIFGKTARLPISLGLFYVIRAIIQSIWYSPFPEGYYWFSPGFPSLVVPYGRGSDFFFSGHTGFMLICLEEWHRIGNKRMRNLAFGATVYTVTILFVYRIHYTIDILVALVFADMCFWWVDKHSHKIDSIAVLIVSGFKWVFRKIFCFKEKQVIDDQRELVTEPTEKKIVYNLQC